MEFDYDAIVIGAGVIGLSCGYQLARNGFKTLVLEQFTIGNKLSSSHGATRIIRKTQGEEIFVQLVLDAYKEWDELSKNSGFELYTKNGLLTIEDQEVTEFRAGLAKKYGFQHEVLRGATEISRHFPQFQNLAENRWAIYEPGAGAVLVENCLKALHSQLLLYRNGSDVHENEKVLKLETHPDADRVEVFTNRRKYVARFVVVAAGAWLSQILPDLPLRAQPTLVTSNFWHVRSRPELFHPRQAGPNGCPAPCLIAVEDNGDGFYSVPGLDYPNFYKLSVHFGVPFDPSQSAENRKAPEWIVEKCTKFVQRHMPDLDWTAPAIHCTCVYTMTDDELFIVDRHPKHPKNILVAGGFSGTGFKFGPTIGKIIVAFAQGRDEELNKQFDMQKLSLSRKIDGQKAKL